MSLAMFAAPFDDEPSQVYINNSHSENPIEKKKMTKTLKKYPSVSVSNNTPSTSVKSMQQQRVDFHKVNQVMQAMSNLPTQNDELGDFHPPPNPISSGVQSTIMRENMESMGSMNNEEPSSNVSSNYNQNAAYNAASFEPSKHNSSRATASGIVNIPNYNNIYNNTPHNTPNTTEDQNALIEKLNYMIHLLEEQQDERTGNVMEEVILYSFLGVFIIFIVDSFCHVGKYTR